MEKGGERRGRDKDRVRFVAVSAFLSQKKRSGERNRLTSPTPGHSDREENVVRDGSFLALQELSILRPAREDLLWENTQ